MIYAGIGSRETPPEILETMDVAGLRLAKAGWILRTGGAPGADQAFWRGASWGHSHLVEVYLPWDGFEGFKEGEPSQGYVQANPSPESFEIAKKYHPAWFKLSQGARRLMARNSHQVLGKDLDEPVDCIICYTEGGKLKGGTAQALRMAEDMAIPVYNLGDPLTGRLFSDILGT